MGKTPQELANWVNTQLGEQLAALAVEEKIEYIPTLIPQLDDMLGGGICRGRVTEIYGNWSSLKTWLGMKLIANVQATGGIAVLINAEKTFNSAYAVQQGVNLNDLIILPRKGQEMNGEQAIDAAELFIRSGVDLLVVDSIPALLPQAEQERSASKEPPMARGAALMSRSLRKLTAVNEDTALVFINQTRQKVGVVFGKKEAPPGGIAINFYANHIIELNRRQRITKQRQGKKVVTGIIVEAMIEKSKTSEPFTSCLFEFTYKDGTLIPLEEKVSQKKKKDEDG